MNTQISIDFVIPNGFVERVANKTAVTWHGKKAKDVVHWCITPTKKAIEILCDLTFLQHRKRNRIKCSFSKESLYARVISELDLEYKQTKKNWALRSTEMLVKKLVKNGSQPLLSVQNEQLEGKLELQTKKFRSLTEKYVELQKENSGLKSEAVEKDNMLSDLKDELSQKTVLIEQFREKLQTVCSQFGNDFSSRGLKRKTESDDSEPNKRVKTTD